ncbi:alpha/beta fold hydrolase [Helicobacter sp. 11S03491-1]|uniref:alpha/beta fold hydrolase n=1 Tax=Helicobacter sp. 11S03491-1 TaxID=1476196 RepID=UPI000BA57766|nr:alpha/beta fold hydrolase [Helicobacter sp. 11S03491-1]PAF43046.1 hypothetical protein BKH45_02980 [Helicobacter sp. 11S03491-1]
MEIIKNLTFKSNFGNIVYDKYLPDRNKAVVIQIAHGMIEHRGRYQWLCENLAQRGYIVFINDHRGHGDSIGNEITWGEMGKNGFEEATKDMLRFHNLIAQEFVGYKQVLLGHSMGSLLSRRFLQLYENKIDALILTGTPSPNLFLGFGSFIFRIFDRLGIKKYPKIGDLLSFNAKFQAYFKPKTNHSHHYWSCSDEEVIKAYLNDPKCRFRFTFNSFANLFEGMRKVFSSYPQKPQNTYLPILFLSGADDVCGNFSKGVQKACHHIQTQGYDNVTLKLYEDTRHEVFNEPNKMQIFQDMLVWLENEGL